ncbi:M14 family metallopeptidase [Opitutaceae bacterium]
MKKLLRLFLLGLGCAVASVSAAAAVTPPKDIIGFAIGDDYKMANYTQITAMWQKWATESDRMKLVSIGNTAEGRPQYMAIVSSPANLSRLEEYRQTAKRLALAEGLDDTQAQALAQSGKAVVWLDGGMHSSESEHSQSLSEYLYLLLSRNDAENLRFLDDVIVLLVNANPDGVELIANWYMREEDESKRTFASVPRMYHKYIGHDNNRDFFMSSMPETTNINRVLYREWFPQIMVNHHQTGPSGQVVFIPPFRDPFNYNLDPLIPIGIDRVGSAMHERLISKGMGGSSMRSAANYSTWWNGGGRTTPYFHNQIGILTEIIGAPTPVKIGLVPSKQLPKGDWPLPIEPQTWHYRQSIEYSNEMNNAVLDYASRNRETLLFNIYRMGKNSIERGSRDHWTVTPSKIAALEAAAKVAPGSGVSGVMVAGGLGAGTVPSELYNQVLRDPANRDPRGFIIPSDQPDFPTAVKFINALMKNGVAIHKATAAFKVGEKTYPAGSYVVQAAQAFRPFVMDMFLPQDHPNDLAYPGGPPIPPYDVAGWTLANQMGVTFDAIQDGFTGPFVRVETDLEAPPAAAVSGPASPAGYLVSHRINDAFILTNRVLNAGGEVYWLKDQSVIAGQDFGTGAIWIPASATVRPIIERAARELGIPAVGLAQKPAGESLKLKPIRIGLIDLYGGVMPSGWLRWLLEQYEFNFEVVFPQVLDAGNLKASFDVLVFPSDTFPRSGAGEDARTAFIADMMRRDVGMGASGAGMGGAYFPPADSIPEEFRSMLGPITAQRTVPPLKRFVEEGGTIVGLGSSAEIGHAMGLPIKNHLLETGPDGVERLLPRGKYYVPGSILRARFDNQHPVAFGMAEKGFVFFNNSPVFSSIAGSSVDVKRVVWFDEKAPLHSGWAIGQEYLEGGDLAAEASIGAGKLVVLGLEATFRATTHGTYKLFFNSLYYGSATETK